ncbi:phage tail protein [Undibacterium curvum]|uniref:phage tail protein n=1 Tax=Undibacterium curvum TaxID=2762294 RepID=UPI003D10C9D0
MDSFIGEIRVCAFPFAPDGWALCDGSVLQISQNVALYSLLGTKFGGDGSKTFGLPDLRGRTMVGQGPAYNLGTKGGAESVTLTSENMPQHNHFLCVSDSPANAANVGASTNRVLAASNIYNPSTPNTLVPGKKLYAKADNSNTLQSSACTPVGGGGAHNNMQTSLVINFMIATKGLYPPRP